MDRLPLEIMRMILRQQGITGEDLAQIRLINENWDLAVRAENIRNVAITQESDTRAFMNYIRQNDRRGRFAQPLRAIGVERIGHLVRNLSIICRPPQPNFPLVNDASSYHLLEYCPNIVTIDLGGVDPFFLFPNIQRAWLPFLTAIHVDWVHCNHSPRNTRRFYRAIYSHRTTLRYFNLPPNITFGRVNFTFNNENINLTELEFIRLFINLDPEIRRRFEQADRLLRR